MQYLHITPMFAKLQAWQAEKGIDDRALGAKVGVDRTTIMRAKRGLYILRYETQLALKEITGITPSEWADHFEKTAPLRARDPKDKEREPEGALA